MYLHVYQIITLPLSLQAGDVPVEFEEFHLSEVQNMASEEKLEQVLKSMKNNKVAMKGLFIWLCFHFFSSLLSKIVFLRLQKSGLPEHFGECAMDLTCTVSLGPFGYAGKIHTPMEFKGELASYEMRLR